MIRYSCLMVVLISTSTFMPMRADAQGWSFEDASTEWQAFALGFATGLGAHELGHYVVATSKGYHVGHDGLSIVYPGGAFTEADQLQVSSAGFQAQWLMAELALRDHSGRELKNPPSNFRAGVVCAHLGITLAYLTVLKNQQKGDVAGMAEASKRSHDSIVLSLAVPAAFDAWRLFGKQVPTWVPQLSLATKGIGVAWVWTY